MTAPTRWHPDESRLSIETGLCTTIGIGYATAVILGAAGFLMFGGPVWSWLLFVWIAGAPITLFFTKTPMNDRETGKTIIATQGARLLLWRIPGLMRRIRFGNGS